jgi:hypothetical protein
LEIGMLKPCAALLAVLAMTGCAETHAPAAIDHARMDHAAHMAQMAREAGVSRRGRDVMPFNLAATTHVFTKAAQGGVQQVLAKDPADSAQVDLIRQHLREIHGQFLRGDFSGPAHIHGGSMPGLARLQAARPGDVAISYRDLPAGGELSYTSSDARLVQALHQWFDAQVSDHGRDARSGTPQH